ncbi:MAG TPA: glycosyltransferase [Candidatus Angelobacter sp.]|jgi:glycosyltransferase involved in cell wall biosynthesis|nr:glycosyltransferase [Candidatus Angelobacter sp.]
MLSNQETRCVHIIVPARNEEDSIGRCLQSLAAQQGIKFAITVVDDGSTDRTRAIAESFPSVTVISSSEPASGITGKCNALMLAVSREAENVRTKEALSGWLLFTDADTFHYPGSLAAAVAEAEEHGAALLSYSPEQETISWSERALMPVVFAELMRSYPPERVNDPTDPMVAANGQYILVRRNVYEALGGHAAVAGCVLEDVELARLFKTAGYQVQFRHGGGLIRTRMYRSLPAMVEGWTKNLALLFAHPMRLALLRLLEFGFIAGLAVAAVIMIANSHSATGLAMLGAALLCCLQFMSRIKKAQFPWKANSMALFGLPFFAFLLLRSHLHTSVRGAVHWKGRKYAHSAPPAMVDSSILKGNPTSKG